MPKESLILNFDDPAIKRQFMSKIGTLRGVWDVQMKPRRYNRSLDQNAYYWAAVVTPFAEFLSEEWGEKITVDQAHELLKVKHLVIPSKVIGGVRVNLVLESRKLDGGEFSAYIERCIGWVAGMFAVLVVPSEGFLGKREVEPSDKRDKTELR